ncbi:Phosphatidylinositol-4-phosphate 5-kinase [Blastocladiella emersonii ATCC 22665]|nr:Phosphatidylinositol-4-phosphate 5-kinase [Blastocladiella emersonii ATCC 22665]
MTRTFLHDSPPEPHALGPRALSPPALPVLPPATVTVTTASASATLYHQERITLESANVTETALAFIRTEHTHSRAQAPAPAAPPLHPSLQPLLTALPTSARLAPPSPKSPIDSGVTLLSSLAAADGHMASAAELAVFSSMLDLPHSNGVPLCESPPSLSDDEDEAGAAAGGPGPAGTVEIHPPPAPPVALRTIRVTSESSVSVASHPPTSSSAGSSPAAPTFRHGRRASAPLLPSRSGVPSASGSRSNSLLFSSPPTSAEGLPPGLANHPAFANASENSNPAPPATNGAPGPGPGTGSRRPAGTASPGHAHRGSVGGASLHRRILRQRYAQLAATLGTHDIDNPQQAAYVFMLHLLTGIRVCVSRGEAAAAAAGGSALGASQPPLTRADFDARHKLASDETGAELPPHSGRYDFKFKDYGPRVFRAIREAFGVAAPDYLHSLTGKYVLAAVRSPGKSASTLYFSHDYRYIIKTIRGPEKKALLRILPAYVEHVRRYPDTLLARFYGLHRLKAPEVGPKAVHVIVMANVFPPNYDIHAKFDLKGSTAGRAAADADTNPHAVLKDLDWLRDPARRMHLGPRRAAAFVAQLERDVLFLMACKLMDYSLLVGIHDLRRGNAVPGFGMGPGAGGENPGSWPATPQQAAQSTPSSPASATVGGGDESSRGALQVLMAPDVFAGMDGARAAEAGQAGGAGRPVVRINTVSELQLPENNVQARSSIFFCDHGGMRSANERDVPGPDVYFVSIIDILTPYNWTKRLEHLVKSVTDDRRQISAVRPLAYGRRFLRFVKERVLG